MKRTIVIGGGFAGLSAAAFLSSEGHSVELIEASPKLGGRAYSFTDEESADIIDNGQHILMGCYAETLNFLRLIGAEENFIIQKSLKVNFLKENFDLIPLKADQFIYPFNLASALLGYKALAVRDRLRLLGLFLKLPLIPEKDVEHLTVKEWLISEKQNENIRRAFWDILAIGALNTDTNKASAGIFLNILKAIFLKGNKASVIILPGKGLSEAYCNDAASFIKAHNGNVITGEQVTGTVNNIKKITEIITSGRRIKDFNFVISAVPDYAFKKLFPDIQIAADPEYSSILSFHIWLRQNPFEEDFYGLIGSPLHWIFNHKSYITLVISNANELIGKSKAELFEIVLSELIKYTGISREDILRYKVIKEKRATFIPSVKLIGKRPGTTTIYNNLFLAGDWINTGLPSTIESAVKSGRLAADKIPG
jgi:squalene-associated FAD-dependent desaturase